MTTRTTAGDEGQRVAVPGGAELRIVRRGSGRPVVLLHTLRTQLDMFSSVLERLENEPLALMAVDLPGHGHSDAPKTDYTAQFFTDTIDGLLRALALTDVILVGESIGGAIALGLAARHHPAIAGVVAVNPYDYGWGGGIRRSSPLANALFTTMLVPGISERVAAAETRRILTGVLKGGLHDPSHLSEPLVDELAQCGRLPGHAHAFSSLTREWRTWIAARENYREVEVPVTLIYGSDDWSRQAERDANKRDIPGVAAMTLERCGHFAALDQPEALSQAILRAARSRDAFGRRTAMN